MDVILASASPRRRELLSLMGIEFSIVIPEVDESQLPEEGPVGLVYRLAELKARSCASGHRDSLVIAADTIVIYQQQILGKPRDRDDARVMLSLLSGQSHRVLTGMAVAYGDRVAVQSSVTVVEFCPLSSSIIDKYIATGEPLDKAGSYGIQGLGGQFVRRLEGSYTNVMGLDLVVMREMLESFGYSPG